MGVHILNSPLNAKTEPFFNCMKASKVRLLQAWASGSAGAVGVGSVVVSGRTVLVGFSSALSGTGDVK